MTTAIYQHPDCARHDMGGGHPESPARMAAIDRALANIENAEALDFRTAPLAEIEALKRIHDADYVDHLFSIAPTTGRVSLDADTTLNPYSLVAARRGAGAAIAATDAVLAGNVDSAFCAVRPPGHHAERDKAMGFCFFDNVAVAAAHALANHGLQRVAIVDFDVHHGNGTEDVLHDEPRALFCSIYQNPLFPFTDDVSVPGQLIKSPLAPGEGSEAFRRAVERDWLPTLDAHDPELLIVSAGFDAHRADPLANLTLDAEDFAWVSDQLVDVAERCCGDRLVASLEGGYNLDALTASARAYLNALVDRTV